MKLKWCLILALSLIPYTHAGETGGDGGPSRGPASIGDQSGTLDVKGQVRSFNRLTSANQRETIDFVKERHDYRAEIETAGF